MNGRTYRRLAIGTLAVLLVVGLVAKLADLQFAAILGALRRFSMPVLGAGVGLVAVQVLLQASRLWSLLPKSMGLDWLETIGTFSFGQMVNTLVPARLGDVVKIFFLKRRVLDEPGNVASLAGSVLGADRLTDLATMVTLALAVSPGMLRQWLTRGDQGPWIQALWIGCLLAVLAAVVAWRLLRRARRPVWLDGVVRGLERLRSPRTALAALLISIGAWSVEAVVVGLLCGSLGHEISFAQGIWVLLVLNLGIAVPVSVANLAVFEAAFTLALVGLGLPAADAVAVAIVHHLLQIVGVAVCALVLHPISREADRESRIGHHHKARAIRHYEGVSSNYEQHVGGSAFKGWMRNRERKVVLRLAALDDGARSMVDVGCGGGFYSLAAKRAGLHVVSTDVAPGMVAAVRDKVDAASVLDIETGALPATFDIVLCSGILDFVVEPEKGFRNLSSMVAPGGRLVLQVPRAGWASYAYRLEKAFAVGIRVNFFTLAWIQRMARECDLQVTGVAYPMPFNMSVRLERRSADRAPGDSRPRSTGVDRSVSPDVTRGLARTECEP